jgi:hypothetical protein
MRAAPSICLNMIVKNEAPVIGRCLASLRSLIDSWVIVDTGSRDGTQALIGEALAGLPGALHERPWRDFGHNRTEALRLAEGAGDYLLFIDADEMLRVPPGFTWPQLVDDAYFLPTEYAGTSYSRCALVSTRLKWRWNGVLHEYLSSEPESRKGQLASPVIVVTHEGARARDPCTYLKDVAIMERALAESPQDTRCAFYLAQSLRDAGLLARSQAAYLERAKMGGWDEEVWYSLYQAARLGERLEQDPAHVTRSYLLAYESRPQRAEPLYHLARLHRLRNEFAVAYLFARRGVEIARPPDMLFGEDEVYRWQLLDEIGISAYYAGARAEGRQALLRLLGENLAPPAEHARIHRNLDFYSTTV